MPLVFSVNPTRRPCRYELDSNCACFDDAFVAKEVYVVTTGIDKPHPLCVHTWLAGGIVPLIGSHRSRRYDNQAMARVRVPAGAPSRLPYIDQDSPV